MREFVCIHTTWFPLVTDYRANHKKRPTSDRSATDVSQTSAYENSRLENERDLTRLTKNKRAQMKPA